MKHLSVPVVFAFVVCACLIGNAWAATYYVAKNGNDANPGSEAEPWLTIQKAADALVAGDTVYIKEGTYNEQVVPQNSGGSGNYITYAAYPVDTATIDGNSVRWPSYETGLFTIEDRSYIIVSGLNILNAGPHDNNAGIYVDHSDHITIQENYTYNTVSSGIGVWNSTNVIIDGNEVQLACNDGEQECITVGGTDTFEVKNNYIHHGGPGTNGGEGIDAKDGSSNGKIYNNHVHDTQAERPGIYLDAWDKHTFNIDVYQNIVHECGAGISVASENGGLLENLRIYNNVVYHNRANGLEIGAWGEPGVTMHPVHNITFINNTLYHNGNNNWGGGIQLENPDASGIVIRNNIFSQNLLFQISNESSGENLTVDHNLLHNYTREYEYEIRGTDCVEGDPEFVGPLGADFHLRHSSPAIDQGSSTNAPSADYDGNQRPQGAGYDIGAYEYAESTPPPFPYFNMQSIATNLITTLTAGDNVHISFTPSVQSALYYQWYSKTGTAPGGWQTLANWTMSFDSLDWSPATEGWHVVLAYVADTPESATYQQIGLTFETEGTGTNPIQITGMTTDLPYPKTSGTPINLYTAATGGNGQLYFRYFFRLGTTGSWNALGPWSASGTGTWTPQQAGLYTVVVHVSNDDTIVSNPRNQAGMTCTIGESGNVGKSGDAPRNSSGNEQICASSVAHHQHILP